MTSSVTLVAPAVLPVVATPSSMVPQNQGMSCPPSCCSVCEAREDSHGNRNLFQNARRFIPNQNGKIKNIYTHDLIPPTH